MSLCPADIKEHVKQLEKAVSGKEPRYVLRALRALPSTSRRLNPNVLHKAIHGFFTSNCTVRDFLLGFLEEVGTGVGKGRLASPLPCSGDTAELPQCRAPSTGRMWSCRSGSRG